MKEIYNILRKAYSSQGWWPIVNDKTLLCEYHTNAPKNEAEAFEIAVSAILAQGTQWYPNVVRAIQQLKLGRTLTIKEQEVLREAEICQKKISGNGQIITKDNILTQSTSWKNVEHALVGLKRASMLSKSKIKDVEISDLANLIISAGYYNQKVKKLKAFVSFKGEFTRDNLLDVWGIGPETADSILLYAYAKPLFVIDAYTKRIFSRLGLAEESASYDSLQNLFHSSLSMDPKLFKEYHALIVEHAKRHCKTKPECEKCPLNNQCRSFKKQKP